VNQLPSQARKWFRSGVSIVLTLTLLSSALLLLNTVRSQEGFVLPKINYAALIPAFLLLLTSWMVEAVRVWLIAAGLGEKIPLRQIININLASTFIGNITPFYSGGVPTQIYLLCQSGIKPGKSSAIVTLRVIISTLLFTLLAPVLLFFYHAKFSFGLLRQVTLAAIPVAAIISFLLIAFIIRPKLANSLALIPLNLIKSAKFHRIIEPFLKKFLNELDIFHESVGEFRKGFYFFLVIAATFAYWLCFFAIAPSLIYAFNTRPTATIIFKSILLQFILIFIVAYLPVPGGSGLMELGIFTLFNFIPQPVRAFFILIWRFISYHLITFVGGIIMLNIINRPQLKAAEDTPG